MDKDQLAALDRAATQGVWEVQDSCSWRRIGTREHDGNVLHPIRTRYDGHPDLSCGAGEDLCATLAFIVALVNLYRTGKLALIDDGAVEAGAKAIFEHFRFGAPVPWVEGGNSDKQHEAREYTRAAIAALTGRV